MERAVARGQMVPAEFHRRKAEMMESLALGVDDGRTKTSGQSRILDFHCPTGPSDTHPRLFQWVRDYYSTAMGRGERLPPRVVHTASPPIYLQHQGHSRTIIGIEERKNGNLCLLIFDPGCPSQELQKLLQPDLSGARLKHLRKLPSALKHKQYQIVAVEGTLSQEEKHVIYVARNPKDVLVSYYHFHKVAVMMETPKDFNEFFDKFMEGRVCGSCWFDHITGWYTHKDEMNFLYLTYEEMIQDLKAAVLKICSFLGKQLDEQQIDSVVKHCTFKQMKTNPNANYESVPESLLNHKNGAFMRKGTVGDWKNHLTVAQNEMFDQVFQERMRDLPLKFVWDISELKTCS
ncbi:UNVERIFIED_CONTAM: hypothetical protein FKN15_009080 [Acipenser sinensis]